MKKDEFNLKNQSRVKFDAPFNPIVIENRIIDNPGYLGDIPRNKSNTFLTPILFINCEFNNSLIVMRSDEAGTVTFRNCTFYENVIIEQASDRGHINFENQCIFKKDLTLNSEADYELSITQITVLGKLKIAGSTNKDVTINNIHESENNSILEISATCNNLIILNSKFILVSIQSNTKSDIIFSNIHAKNVSFHTEHTIYHLDISDNCIIQNLAFKKVNKVNNLNISNNTNISRTEINLDLFKKVTIANSIISHITLKHTNETDNIIIIKETTFDKLYFADVVNKGLISLKEIEINSNGKLSIKSSNLGKCDFINCSFVKATFEFENSKLIECFISETDFPETVKLNDSINNAQAQLAFGQLYTAFQKQGDSIRSIEYQSREIEAHYNNLTNWRSSNFPFINFNKINLWLNKWSNNFGRFWMRGVVFTIISGFIFFYLLLISSNEYVIALNFTIKKELFLSFLKFMNPIRFYELENVFKHRDSQFLTLNWSSYFFDFLGRIFITYGFYQTIQAFRKFGRK